MSEATKDKACELLAQSLVAWRLTGSVVRSGDGAILIACNGIDISVVTNAAHYLRGKADREELAAVQKWTDYQADKIKRGLVALEAEPPALDPLPNVGQIALACFLGHRDLRFAGDWRAAHPSLVHWLDRFAAKVPAFAETKVAA